MDPSQYTYLITTVVIVSTLGLIAAIFVVSRRMARRRTEELQSAAFSLGYDFHEEDPNLLDGEIGQLPFFRRGRRGRVRNVCRRRVSDGEVLLFDYRYTTGGGKNSSTHRQTVYAVRNEKASIPAFELRPEHIFHKIGGSLGYQDIDFDDSPIFSKAYLVRGEHESAVRSFLTPAARNQMETSWHWTMEGSGPWLILLRAGRRVKTADVDTFLRDCDVLTASLLGHR